jgi:hypothetical protein
MKPISACHLLTLLGILALPISVAQATEAPVAASTAEQYQQWIIDMKAAERGPFARIRWFCNDGRILPPKAYACGPQGGQQHGEWSAHTQQLRGDGYKIANLLAGIDAPVAIAQTDFNDSYNQILIEKFLIAADDGWILRRAMFYRGAFQEEAEARGGRELLEIGQVVGEDLSAEMKAILGDPGINHKFVKGLARHPEAKIYRKSGSWKRWHDDSALIEAGDKKYIVVGLVEDTNGGAWLSRMIGPIHELMAAQK